MPFSLDDLRAEQEATRGPLPLSDLVRQERNTPIEATFAADRRKEFDSKDIVARSLEAAGFKDALVDDLDEETQKLLQDQRDMLAQRTVGNLPEMDEINRSIAEARTIVDEFEAIDDADVSDERLEEIRRDGLKNLPEPLRLFGDFALQRALVNGSMAARALSPIIGNKLADDLLKESDAVQQALRDTGTSGLSLVASNAIGNITDILLLGKMGIVSNRSIAAVFGFSAFNRAMEKADVANNPTLNNVGFALGQGAIEYLGTITFGKLLGPGAEGVSQPLRQAAGKGITSVLRRIGLTGLAEIPEELAIEIFSKAQAVLQGFDEIPTQREVWETFRDVTLGSFIGGGTAGVIQTFQQKQVDKLEQKAQPAPAAVTPDAASTTNTDTITLTKEAAADLKRAANQDELTGLGNKRLDKRAVKTLFRRADREGTDTALVSFDVANFKSLNDTLGLEKGDQALQIIADAIQAEIRTERKEGEEGRPRDVAGVATRPGGDEFNVLLPSSSAEAGQAVATRIQKRVDAKLKEAGLQLPIEGRPVFLAPGVVMRSPKDTRSIDALRNEADFAVKAEKKRVKTELGVPLTRDEAGDTQPQAAVPTQEVAPATSPATTQQTGSQPQQTQAPQTTDTARLTPGKIKESLARAPKVLTPSQAKAVTEGKPPVRKVVKRKKGIAIAPATEAKAFKAAKLSSKPPKTPRQFFGEGFRRAAAAGRARLEGLKQELTGKADFEAASRKDLAKLARTLLPRTESAKLLQAIANAKTPRQAQAIRGRIGAAIEVVAKRDADLRLKRLRKKTKFKTLEAPVVEQFGKSQITLLKNVDPKGMTAEQVNALSDEIAAINAMQKDVKNLRLGTQAKSLDDLSKVVRDNVNKTGKFDSGNTEATNQAHQFVIEESLKPEMLMEQMDGQEDGEIHQALYQAPVDGITKMHKVRQSALEFFEKKLSPKTLAKINTWGRQSLTRSLAGKLRGKLPLSVNVKLDSGRIVTMTRQELMYVLASNRVADNRAEILRTGLSLARTRAQKKMKLTENDLARFETVAEQVDPDIGRGADAVIEYLNEVLGPEYDAAHIALNGFSNKRDQYLFIRRNLTERLPTKFDLKSFNDLAVAEIGEAKERKGGTASVMVDDLFVTLDSHIRRVGGFIGLARTLRNATMVLNHPRVAKAMDTKFGTQRRQAIKRLYDAVTREVVGHQPGGFINRTAGKLVDRATIGVLSANPAVILKQPVSILGASTEIEMKYLVPAQKAAAKLGPIGTAGAKAVDKRMVEWNPNLWARFRTSRLRLVGQFVAEQGTVLDRSRKLGEKFMAGISGFDRLAIRTIHRAAELKVSDQTDLTFGSPEYIAAVNKIVDRVIARTQPTVSVMDQSGIQIESRTSFLAKVSTSMFMSQRNQYYNMIARAIRRGGKKGIKDLTLIMAVSPLFIMSIDALRRWAYGYDDDRETIEKVQDGLFGLVEQNLSFVFGAQAVLDIMRGVKDIAQGSPKGRFRRRENIISGIVTQLGQGILDITTAVNKAGESFKAGDKRGQSIATDKLISGIKNLTFAFGSASGSPISSPLRLVIGLGGRVLGEEEYAVMFKERSRLRKVLKREQETGRLLLSDFQREKLSVIEESLVMANLAHLAAEKDEITKEEAETFITKALTEGLQAIETLEDSVPKNTFNAELEGPDPFEENVRELRKDHGSLLLKFAVAKKEAKARDDKREMARLRAISAAVTRLRKAAALTRTTPARRASLKGRIKKLLEKAVKK